MIRNSQLPCLPGYSFNYNVGQTKFHKPQHFTILDSGVHYLSDKPHSGIGGTQLPTTSVDLFPSLYAKGEVAEIPRWLAFNKQTLYFDAYYTENVQDHGIISHVVHKCKVSYFLEDGTIQVIEKPVINSGLPQGCIIKRQKIRLPGEGNCSEFYDIFDLNIEKDIEFFGKVFHLTSCDIFTRQFLNRLGIAVPDPVEMPDDPYMLKRSQADKKQRKSLKGHTINSLLEMDNRILTFIAYWDDQDTEYGFLHDLKVLYYIADKTIEIKDVSDQERIYTIVKRSKMAKVFEEWKSKRVYVPKC